MLRQLPSVVGIIRISFYFAVAVLLASCTTHANEDSNSKSNATAKKKDEPKTKSAFPDPAPPELLKVGDRPTPTPKPYERVTFRKKPKPLPKGAVTHNWTKFLGPTHNAISTETKLLKKWPKSGPQLVWELEKGSKRDVSYSSPAIQDEFLVVPHRVTDQVFVECLHPETGQLYWQFKFPTKYRDRYQYGNGPRASPVISDGRVYIYSAEGNLYCLKLTTGQLYWKRELFKEFNVQQDFFGVVTTPLVQGNLLIINVGAPDGPSVIGLNKTDGKVVWGSSNSKGSNKWAASYASPVPALIHGQRRVFVFAGGDSQPPTGGLLCLDPANGHVDFEFPWRSRTYESVNASCPVVINNQVFISATYRRGSTLLKIDSDFSATPVWKTSDREHNTREDQLGLHWNTAVYKDGHLYAFDGRNEPDASLVCVDVKTGKVVWREIPEWDEKAVINGQAYDVGATLRGSLLSVDGQFLCLGELGHLMWLELSPRGYKELARTRLFLAPQSWALPIISRGLLYISQNQPAMLTGNPTRLLCYDLRGQ